MDEEENSKNSREPTADNSRTDKGSSYENMRGPLVDKSNSIQIS